MQISTVEQWRSLDRRIGEVLSELNPHGATTLSFFKGPEGTSDALFFAATGPVAEVLKDAILRFLDGELPDLQKH